MYCHLLGNLKPAQHGQAGPELTVWQNWKPAQLGQAGMELTVRKICRQNGRRSQETNIDYFAQEEEGAQVISNLWREKGLGHSQSCQIVIRTGKKCAGLALFTGKLSSCCGLMNLEEIRKSLSLDDPESLEEDSYANQLYTHAFFQWIHVKIASKGKVCKCMHFCH